MSFLAMVIMIATAATIVLTVFYCANVDMDGLSEYHADKRGGRERVGLRQLEPAHSPSATRRVLVDAREASSSSECGQV